MANNPNQMTTLQLQILISNLSIDLSSSTNYRSSDSNEETLIKDWITSDSDSFICELSCLLVFPGTDSMTRALSSILLRRYLTRRPDSDSFLYPRISYSTKSKLRCNLFISFYNERDQFVSKNLSYTLSELAFAFLPDSSWPPFLDSLFNCIKPPKPPAEEKPTMLHKTNPLLQENSLLILSSLGTEILLSRFDKLIKIFKGIVKNSTAFNVLIAALATIINFLQDLSIIDKRDRLLKFFPEILKKLTVGQEVLPQKAIELLIEHADSRFEPPFLYMHFDQILDDFIMRIAGDTSLKQGTRRLAIEFIVTLCEARECPPIKMRKLLHFSDIVVPVIINLLLDIGTDNYIFGRECVSRLAVSLGRNTVLVSAANLLSTYLAAPDWKKRNAAFVALQQIFGGSEMGKQAVQNDALADLKAIAEKDVLPTLRSIVDSSKLNLFFDLHPRVHLAAIDAIKQLSTYLGSDFHHLVLQALNKVMDDFHEPELQAYAASQVLNFTKYCTPAIVMLYVNEILTKLLLLQGNYITCDNKRIGICIFSNVAEHCRDATLKYYDLFLPFLLEVCSDPCPYVREAAVCGVGVCAEFGGSVFEPFLEDAHSKLNVLITDSNAQDLANAMAYNSAIVALSKITQFHQNKTNTAQTLKTNTPPRTPAWQTPPVRNLPSEIDQGVSRSKEEETQSLAEFLTGEGRQQRRSLSELFTTPRAQLAFAMNSYLIAILSPIGNAMTVYAANRCKSKQKMDIGYLFILAIPIIAFHAIFMVSSFFTMWAVWPATPLPRYSVGIVLMLIYFFGLGGLLARVAPYEVIIASKAMNVAWVVVVLAYLVLGMGIGILIISRAIWRRLTHSHTSLN